MTKEGLKKKALNEIKSREAYEKKKKELEAKENEVFWESVSRYINVIEEGIIKKANNGENFYEYNFGEANETSEKVIEEVRKRLTQFKPTIEKRVDDCDNSALAANDDSVSFRKWKETNLYLKLSW